MIIAIDGPAGAGKSAAARLLAQRLGLPYLDTGAMYRTLALRALEEGIPLPPEGNGVSRLVALARQLPICFAGTAGEPRVFLGGRDVTEAIRSEEVSRAASLVSAVPEVREELVARQRQLGEGGAVVEGRDIGTVVFPDAPVKFFLTARPEVRAQRRQAELAGRGRLADLEQIVSEIRERDLRDATRPVSPLQPATDALVVDTSDLDLQQVVDLLYRLVREKLLDI